MTTNFHKQDHFTKAYIVAALWTSEEEENQKLFETSNINKEVMSQIILECKNFQQDNKELLEQAYENRTYSAERAGHDFWLTRNHHGAGFWDRGLGEVGDSLTDKAQKLKESDLYIGDDNQLYFSNLPKDRTKTESLGTKKLK